LGTLPLVHGDPKPRHRFRETTRVFRHMPTSSATLISGSQTGECFCITL